MKEGHLGLKCQACYPVLGDHGFAKVTCDLEAGHEGPHEVVRRWPNYKPQCSETIQLAGGPILCCTNHKGHGGLHQNGSGLIWGHIPK